MTSSWHQTLSPEHLYLNIFMISATLLRNVIGTARVSILRPIVRHIISANMSDRIIAESPKAIEVSHKLAHTHINTHYITSLTKPRLYNFSFLSMFLQIAGKAKTVAVLGIKTDAKASQPAYFVPEFLQSTGIHIIPVPVFFPDAKEILGEPVIRDLKQIKEKIDILDVFRRPEDLPQHLEDILAMDPRPDVVWLQSGISNREFEDTLAENGITVVVNRCLKVDRNAAGFRAKF